MNDYGPRHEPEKTTDGGPAFPQSVSTADPGGQCSSMDWADASGMSLRAYYAGQAMAGLLANSEVDLGIGDLADYSVKYSDALIERLKK